MHTQGARGASSDSDDSDEPLFERTRSGTPIRSKGERGVKINPQSPWVECVEETTGEHHVHNTVTNATSRDTPSEDVAFVEDDASSRSNASGLMRRGVERARTCAPDRYRGSSQTPMQPTGNTVGARQVLFLRHGEGIHNATKDWSIFDPSLTPVGEAQADALAGSAVLADCELLVVSPLRRAIETAVRALPWSGTWSATADYAAGTPDMQRRVVLLPLHSERWSAPCDEGHHKLALSTMFSCVRGWEGFSELADDWSPKRENDRNWIQERVPRFKQWLAEQPERRIVVVGHGAFFHECLGGRHLRNCEVAQFEEEPTGDKLRPAVFAAKAGDWDQLQQLMFSEGGERVLSDALINSIPEGASHGLLHQIAWHGAEEIYKLLVSKGVRFDLALLTQYSRSGKPRRTAQQVARSNGHHAFAYFLDQQLQAVQSEPMLGW